MPSRTIRRITISQAVALAFMVLAGGFAIITTRRFLQDADQVAHTYQVRGTLQSLASALETAKADARGFLLTGDSTYMTRSGRAIDSATTITRALEDLMADEPNQAGRIRRVPPLIALRRDKLMQTMALPALATADRAQYAARLQEGEAIAGSIATIIDSTDREEMRLLAARRDTERQSQATLVVVLGAMVILAGSITWAFRRTLIRDLHQRARIEADLRASEARFSGILAIAADAIVSVDESQNIVHFNHAAEMVFGYLAAEVIGQPLAILLPDGRSAAHATHVERFGKSGDVARQMADRQEVSGRRRDGTEFPADVSISKLTTPDGALYTAVVRDITEQQRLEHHEHTLAVVGARLGATLDYEAMLRLVVDLPVHAIGDWCIVDIIERREEGAETFRRLASLHTDYKKHRALQALAAEPLDWDSPSAVIDVIRTGEPIVLGAVSQDWLEAHATSDASLGHVATLGIGSLLSVPLSARGKVLGVMTIGRHDPTLLPHDLALARIVAEQCALAIDNTLLYQRAQQARATRDEVLAIVSHDLRTPASAIAMCARTLLDHPPETPEARRQLHATILESAGWMYRLIQDLLDAASIDAGRLAVSLEVTRIEAILDSTVGAFLARATDANITLSASADAGLGPVFADPGRVGQVLGNLVTNALRFTPAGGAIKVHAARRADGVLITVSDTGIGIDPTHLPHIFNRFWHAGGVGRGSGLGLAIASGIVQAHGGRIWVDSKPGAGSTFSFVLPSV